MSENPMARRWGNICPDLDSLILNIIAIAECPSEPYFERLCEALDFTRHFAANEGAWSLPFIQADLLRAAMSRRHPPDSERLLFDIALRLFALHATLVA